MLVPLVVIPTPLTFPNEVDEAPPGSDTKRPLYGRVAVPIATLPKVVIFVAASMLLKLFFYYYRG